jgi:hypothetical protein
MIGVVVDPAEQDVASEFFELFKTPWELYREHRHYDVLLCTRDFPGDENAKLVVYYSARNLKCDTQERTAPCSSASRILLYREERIPIYGYVATFPNQSQLLIDEDLRESAGYLRRSGDTVFARLGYDLFAEVQKLLTAGQPIANAHIPTLELHISLLRNLMRESRIPFVEVPPTPDGYGFIACLTHDVDHPSLRQHRWDHTVFGFLYRAVFVSLRNFTRGQIPFGDLVRNWTAAFKLPLVQLNLSKDLWTEFDDCYRELEKGVCSTFFVIPFKNQPGFCRSGPAPSYRAARYGAKDISGAIDKMIASGCEVGVHGIDAWMDSERGCEEIEEIRGLTGVTDVGVRMHWLYYDEDSPLILEKLGAAYDATVGYNETVGYRAGTTQSYKALQTKRLMELPLHVMDTALFYPSYLGLSPSQARSVMDRMMDNVMRLGGCFTVNWHDRSVLPERCWDGSYSELLADLKQRGAWFSTVGQAVNWFKKRRSVVFEDDHAEHDAIGAKATGNYSDDLPGLRLRIYQPSGTTSDSEDGDGYFDVPFDGVDTRVACGVRG